MSEISDIFACNETIKPYVCCDCDCPDYPEELTELKEQVDSLDAKVEALEEADSEFQNTLDKLEDRMDSADAMLSDKITGIEDNVNYKLSDMESNIEAQDTKLSDMESNIEAQDTKISDMESNIEAQDTKISDMESNIEAQGTKISDMESNIEAQGTKISDMESNIEAQDTKISDMESKISTVYKYKGSVETTDDLPDGAEVGDVYNILATDVNYAWTGEEWDALGGTFDDSELREQVEQIEGNVTDLDTRVQTIENQNALYIISSTSASVSGIGTDTVNITSFEIPAGVWIVTTNVRATPSATGTWLAISISEESNVRATSGENSRWFGTTAASQTIGVSRIIYTETSEPLYITGYGSSSSSTFTATYCSWRALRICDYINPTSQ